MNSHNLSDAYEYTAFALYRRAILWVLWAGGAIIGVPYWAMMGDPTNALLSVVVPWFGALSLAFAVVAG